MEVKQLRWPAEEARRAELRTASIPRLLLVEGNTPPPVASDGLEDWIRLPANEVDLRARIAALELRSTPAFGVEPLLDRDGVLRVGPSWVSLSPVEARLISALMDRFGAVVSRDSMERAGWPEEPANHKRARRSPRSAAAPPRTRRARHPQCAVARVPPGARRSGRPRCQAARETVGVTPSETCQELVPNASRMRHGHVTGRSYGRPRFTLNRSVNGAGLRLLGKEPSTMTRYGALSLTRDETG